MNRRVTSLLLLLAAFAFLALAGCSEEDEPGIVEPDADLRATCEGCHTSEANLRATALPDPPPSEGEGEG